MTLPGLLWSQEKFVWSVIMAKENNFPDFII